MNSKNNQTFAFQLYTGRLQKNSLAPIATEALGHVIIAVPRTPIERVAYTDRMWMMMRVAEILICRHVA